MIVQWAKDPYAICGIVLTPTRELAIQIADQFQAIGSSANIKVCVVIGGMDMTRQSQALKERPHFVIATPGRLADEILSNGEEIIPALKRAKFLVLDEADRLLSQSMSADLNTCLSVLAPPEKRQTLLFTATVTESVLAIKDQSPKPGKKPVFIQEISSDEIVIPDTLSQTYIFIPSYVREAYLYSIITHEDNEHKSTIVFVNRTSTAEMLRRTLEKLDVKVVSLHSEMPQRDRINSLTKFRLETARVLVATDVAGRGLDIPAVEMVINYEIPANPHDYVHRVGRTARAGRHGESISLVSEQDVNLIHKIEETVGSRLEEYTKITEDDVLNKTLTPVSIAKRESIMDMDRDNFGEQRKIREKKRRQRDMNSKPVKSQDKAGIRKKKSSHKKKHSE